MLSTLPPLAILTQRFDASKWLHDTSVTMRPRGYQGTTFGLDAITTMIVPNDDEESLLILGVHLPVHNLHLGSTADEDEENHPFYFEATGKTFHYVVSVWGGCTTIEVHDLDIMNPDLRKKTLESVMFPATEAQLRTALQTLVDDCS